jgi:hypothetical protein
MGGEAGQRAPQSAERAVLIRDGDRDDLDFPCRRLLN